MEPQDKRMQCLRLAAELGGDVDTVIATAQRMFDFVKGAEPAASAYSPAANSSPEPIAVAEPQAEVATAQAGTIAEAAISEPLVAEHIAACGTALVMPEGGNLAEALLSPEAVTAAEVQVEVAAEEGPAEIKAEEALAKVTTEETSAEAAAEEVHAEAVAEETPAEAAAEEVHAEAVAEETPAEVVAEKVHAEAASEETPDEITTEETQAEAVAEETPTEVAAKEAHAEVAAEEAQVPATNPTLVVPVPPASLTDLIGEQPAPHA